MRKKRLLYLGILSALLFLCTFAVGIDSASARARFGTACQKDYQNGWLHTLDQAWDRCGAFNDELDDTDTKVFYYNLHDAKWWWEEGGDADTLDSVNLFYANTHGGGWATKSVWSMWNEHVRADSTRMRLGNTGEGLSILATHSCQTLKFNDDKMWTRMGPVFRGGLRIAVGSHHELIDSFTSDEAGEDFADNLQSRTSIKWSWHDAISDWATDQDAAVMATGSNMANCENRRDGMKWQNYKGYPRLRDGQTVNYCYWYWDNL